MSAPRLFFPDAKPLDGRVELRGPDAHRLLHVLRLKPGDALALFDGRGHEWAGRLSAVTKQAAELAELTPIEPIAEPRVPVTLAIGVLKGDQMDAVVRDATMLGVAAIQPVQTAHVTVTPKAWQSGAARQRWERVAAASATQCRRAVVPRVLPVIDFESCLREPAAVRLMCVEPSAAAVASRWSAGSPPASVQLLVGPEGGWAQDEVDQALAAGALAVSLGPRTLRAESVPLVALTLVASAWGW